MGRPTVCVVIPAHPGRVANGMLDEALASVHAQTLLPDQVSIAYDLDGDGAPVTRARALAGARTEWVCFLDSDDLYLPKHIEWCLAHAVSTGADFVYPWFKVMQQWPDGRRNILENDPVFPVGHYLNEFNPDDPVETTITVLVRTELAQQVGMRALDRGQINTGEDRAFTLDCLAAGANIKHLRRKSWLWRHWWLDRVDPDGNPLMGNTSGLPTKGDGPSISQ